MSSEWRRHSNDMLGKTLNPEGHLLLLQLIAHHVFKGPTISDKPTSGTGLLKYLTVLRWSKTTFLFTYAICYVPTENLTERAECALSDILRHPPVCNQILLSKYYISMNMLLWCFQMCAISHFIIKQWSEKNAHVRWKYNNFLLSELNSSRGGFAHHVLIGRHVSWVPIRNSRAALWF